MSDLDKLVEFISKEKTDPDIGDRMILARALANAGYVAHAAAVLDDVCEKFEETAR